MARTHTAPWDYQQQEHPTLTQLREDNSYIEYCMILIRLERDYGIDKMFKIVKSWGKVTVAEKLELARQLDAELNECTCLPDLPDGRGRGHCYARHPRRDDIYIGGE